MVLAILALVTASCGNSSSATDDSTSSNMVSGSLTVSAAASLQSAFTDMRSGFEKSNPGVSVTLNFGASSTLAQQIISGAPVDVFASADESNMKKIADASLVKGDPRIFATNSLEIIVRKGNPSNISTIADLARPGIVYITCAPEVPIGRYGAQVLRDAGVSAKPSSYEPDVKGIVTKVTAGEADAGIVYATDVTATRGAASGVAIPMSSNLVATYPIASISTSRNISTADAWIAFVTSTEGRAILHAYGFGTP